MSELPVDIPLVVGVLVAIVVSAASNALYMRGIADLVCAHVVRFSPNRRAFAIWRLLYPFAVLFAVAQLVAYGVDRSMFAAPAANVLFALSWVAAALWTPAFYDGKPESLVQAAMLLLVSAGCACAAAVAEGDWRARPADEWRRWTLNAPLSLLAGWLLVALALSVAIAAKATLGEEAGDDDTECGVYPEQQSTLFGGWTEQTESPVRPNDQSQSASTQSASTQSDSKQSGFQRTMSAPLKGEVDVVPLALALAAAAAATALSDPLFPLPVAWAVANMRSSRANAAGFGVAVAGSAAAAFGAYV